MFLVDCEKSLGFCSKIREGRTSRLAYARSFAFFPADFRAKERLLAVYVPNCELYEHDLVNLYVLPTATDNIVLFVF